MCISGSHFHLHTLYCGLYRDIVGIIKSQSSLNIIGIYLDDALRREPLLPNMLTKLEDNSIHIPFIFGLSCEDYNTQIQYTVFPEIFPISHSEGPIYSLLRSLSMYSRIHPYRISAPQDGAGFTIYLSDFSNMPAISCLLDNISRSFVYIFSLEFCIHNDYAVVGVISWPLLDNDLLKRAHIAFGRFRRTAIQLPILARPYVPLLSCQT